VTDEIENMMAPPVRAEEGWTPLSPMTARSGRSYVLGKEGDERMRVAYFRRECDGALVGRVWFGPWCEGPPGHAHGGSMAAVLDDAIGKIGWLAGYRVVAARITVNFRRMLPLGTDARIEAWIERKDGRKLHTKGRLVGDDGAPYAEAEGVFVELSSEGADRLASARPG
jgi:acyl-coenzyme A thioesterase PaaI-like protein